MAYFRQAQPGQLVRAVPGAGLDVPVWILGSSLFGAQLAAALGLPYAFASHFAPAQLMQAIAIYRAKLPAVGAARPALRDARRSTCSPPIPTRRRSCCFTSMQQAFVNLRSGRPAAPAAAGSRLSVERLAPAEAAMLEQVTLLLRDRLAGNGAPGLEAFIARTGADELIVTSQIFDHRDPVAVLRDHRRFVAVRFSGGKFAPSCF